MSASDAVETPVLAAAVPEAEQRATGRRLLLERRSEPVAVDSVERAPTLAGPPAIS